MDISPQIPENLVYPPKPGTQYVIIEATWAPTSVSSSMEKLVLVAPHAGYIFIQTDKTIYTPEQSGTAPPRGTWPGAGADSHPVSPCGPQVPPPKVSFCPRLPSPIAQDPGDYTHLLSKP